MPIGIGVRARVLSATLIISAYTYCLLPAYSSQQKPAKSKLDSPNTLFVDCDEHTGAKRVVGHISVSRDKKWHAFVEVKSSEQCLQTTRLWVANRKDPPRLVYFLPPERDFLRNGMDLLEWEKNSHLLLAWAELWQDGSDAMTWQKIIAIDAATGMVYEPELEKMFGERKDRQCTFRITGATFDTRSEVSILIRAKFFTAIDEGERESDVPPTKRCATSEEVWRFNYATGEVSRMNKSDTPLDFKVPSVYGLPK